MRWPLGLVLVATVIPEPASAYRCTRVGGDDGPSLIWSHRALHWSTDEGMASILGDQRTTLGELVGAFQAWEDVDCSDLSFPFDGVQSGLQAGYNRDGANINAVVLVNTGWAYDRGALAVTTTVYNSATGVMTDGDIEVNGQYFRFVRADESCDPRSGVMDLRNALTHEVGHVIGLDHPPNQAEFRDTTMFATAIACETQKQTLEGDDRQALCDIYPAGQPTQQCHPPEQSKYVVVDQEDGFGCQNGTPGAGTWVLGLGLLAWIFKRRAPVLLPTRPRR